MAQGPSRRTQWDLNLQSLKTCMSLGVGSTTELSPTTICLTCMTSRCNCSYLCSLKLTESVRFDRIYGLTRLLKEIRNETANLLTVPGSLMRVSIHINRT